MGEIIFFLKLGWSPREELSKACLRAEARENGHICSPGIFSRVNRNRTEELKRGLFRIQVHLAMLSQELLLWIGMMTSLQHYFLLPAG